MCSLVEYVYISVYLCMSIYPVIIIMIIYLFIYNKVMICIVYASQSITLSTKKIHICYNSLESKIGLTFPHPVNYIIVCLIPIQYRCTPRDWRSCVPIGGNQSV